MSVGDLKIKMGMDLSALDRDAARAVEKARSIGRNIVDPKIGIDTKAFDRGSAAVQKTIRDIERRDTVVKISADTSTAEGRAERLQAVLDNISGAQYVAQVHADTEQAHDELQELKRLFDRMDDTPEVIRVRADVDAALRDLGSIRRELKDIDGASIETSTRLAGFGGTLGSIARQALGVAGGIGIANVASNLLGTAFNFVQDAVVGANVEFENASAKLMAFTKNGAETERILGDIREEAEKTPFAFQDMADAVSGLYPVAKRANEPLMELVETAEILAASNPAEGLVGAAFAIKEAASGDFQSAIERFNLARSFINQLKEEGVPNLEILRRAIQDAGFDITLVSNLSQTASGKWSTFMDTVREAGRRIGEPMFAELKTGLDGLIAFTETEQFSTMIEDWAAAAKDLSGWMADAARSGGEFVTAMSRVNNSPAENAGDVAPGVGFRPPESGSSGQDGSDGFLAKLVTYPWDVVTEQLGQAAEEFLVLNKNVEELTADDIQLLEELAAKWSITNSDERAAEILRVRDAWIQQHRAAELILADLNNMGETGALNGLSEEFDGLTYAEIQAAKASKAFAAHLLELNTAEENQIQTAAQHAQVVRDQAAASEQQTRFTQAVADGNMSAAQAANDYTYVEAAANVVRLEAAAFARNLAEQQQGLAGAYQSGLGALAAYNQQAGEYKTQAGAVEAAVAELQERQENGEQLSEREIELLENKDTILGRLNGGVEDATIQAGLAAGANGLLMQAQDDFNRALADGEIDQETYNQKLRDAQALYGDPDQTDPMQQSLGEIKDVIANDLIGSIDDLTRKIEYISKPWLVEIDAATEAAEAELLRIEGIIARINSSNVAPYMPGAGDPGGGGQAFAEGGIVTGPTFALIGEDGDELVLPLTKPDRMKELLAQAGIPAWADGGGVMSGSRGGGRGALTLDVQLSGDSLDWSWLFVGLDEAAEDYASRAAERVADFVARLDGADLASGEALADAEAKLTSAVNAKAMAGQMGLGEAVLAELQAKIEAAQGQVNAIGAAMGTPLVAGLAEALAAGEIAEELAEFRAGVFDGLDLSDAGDGLDGAIARVTALRDAALEMGDAAEADRLTAQIATLNAELALTTDILSTDAVQAWQANEDAAAAARAEAEAWAATFDGLNTAGGLDQAQQDFRDAQLALQAGIVTPGTDPETMRQLQEDYDAALAALERYETGFQAALDNGLFTQDELMEQARTGGDTLLAILREGALSEEQIRELVESGDAGVQAILESFFGPGVIADWEAGWQAISDTDFAALAGMEPAGEAMGNQWVTGVLAGLENGRLSVAQAIELLTDDAGEISDEAALSLLDTWRQVGADLDRAMATGEGLTEAQAAYDQFYAFLIEFAAKHGLVAEDVIASWEAMEAAANAGASSLSGKSMAMGGSAGAADIDRLLSGMVEFSTTQSQLAGIIEHVTGGDLSVTLADDTLSYLGQIFSDPTLPQAFKDYVTEGLAQQLDGLDISADDQLATLNAELSALGLKQLTADEWATMTRSEIAAIDEGVGMLADTFVRQTDRTIAAWDRYMAGAGAAGTNLGAAGGMLAPGGFDGRGARGGRGADRLPVILMLDRRVLAETVADLNDERYSRGY